MCGRYVSNDEEEMLQIIRTNKLFYDELLLDNIQYNKEVFPSQNAPIITQERKLITSKWGFEKWDGKGIIINARSETLATSRFFSPHLNNGRCIIPAKAYFEWLKVEKGKSVKYQFKPKEMDYLYIAGLIKRVDAEKSTFVIITKDADPSISYIHDRMPLIFDQEKMERWLFDSLDTKLLGVESIDVYYEHAN